MNTIKIYVGCALKHAPEDFKEKVQGLIRELEKNPRYEILKFLGKGDPSDIFRRDILECVANADVLLAIVDLPSTGLGFEMGVLWSSGRPLLAVAHNDAVVSGLVLGIHGGGPFTFRKYAHISQVPEIFTAWLEQVLREQDLPVAEPLHNPAFQNPAFLPGHK